MFGAGQQALQICGEIGSLRQLDVLRHLARHRRFPALQRTFVDRSVVGERLVGNFGDDFSVLQHAHLAIGGDAADFDCVQSPFFEDAKHFLLAAFLRHQQHALLRFAQHDFVGSHAGFALRHKVEFDFSAHAARARPFRK